MAVEALVENPIVNEDVVVASRAPLWVPFGVARVTAANPLLPVAPIRTSNELYDDAWLDEEDKVSGVADDES